jgi:vacuolar protein sorting-associated protein 54
MNGSSSSKHIRIEDRTYFTVSATADVLGLLLDYLKVIINLSMLTTDTMGRIIEFLKAFNSRTCQVVLGAGAMRSAGLKNITAKHLGMYKLI